MRWRPDAWRRRAGWFFAIAVVLAAMGIGVIARLARAKTSYRTASATMASVDALLRLHATLQPSTRVTASFGVGGTVATVAVAVGQRVTAGQTLATIVPNRLQQQVSVAQANLVAAQAALVGDEAAQRAPTTTTTSTTTTTTTTMPSTTVTVALATVRTAQKTVVDAQKTADVDAQAASADEGLAESACGKHSTSPSRATPAACSSALASALAAEQSLAQAQRAVAKAEDALANELAGKPSSGPTPTGTPPPGTTPAGGAAPATGSTPPGPPTPHAQAAQLANDQATVDADRATLIAAQQALDAARLTSPTGGTVAAVGVAPGQSVSPGTAAQAITVLSQGSFEAVANIRVSQVPQVAVGDAATVSIEGRPGTITGTVSRIGPVNTNGGYTYPLVVSLPPATHGLFAGSIAQLAVLARQAHHVLAVPTSAVHTGTGGTYVLSLRHGRAVRIPVATGIVGDTYTQVRSGLSRRATVVLATLTRPIPTGSGPAGHGARGFNGTPLKVSGGT